MTPQQLAGKLHRFADKLEQSVRDAEELSGNEMLFVARQRSSGTLSLAEMAKPKWDHPYARRHGRPKLTPGIINQQSGELRQSWQMRSGDTGGSLETVIFNTADHARYLWSEESGQGDGGTSVMFGRPVHIDARAQVSPMRDFRLKHALSRAAEVLR